MLQDASESDIETVLDKLQGVYRFRLVPELLPSVFQHRFYTSVGVFSEGEIPESRMGIIEEVGDIIYQIVKMIAVKKGILIESDQRKLFERYGFLSGGVEFELLYDSARELVPEFAVEQLVAEFPSETFLDGERSALEFFANQYVSYITRGMRTVKNKGGVYHSVEYIKTVKILEESAELVEVLNKFDGSYADEGLLDSLRENLDLSSRLVEQIREFVGNEDGEKRLMSFLDQVLKQRVRGSIGIGDVFDFCLFKIRGRQELCFQGYTQRDIMHICKPTEYLLEAELVSRRVDYF